MDWWTRIRARIVCMTSCLAVGLALGLALILTGCGSRDPAVLKLAVDASFQPAIEALRPDFEASCGCRLEITSGASGLLYSQIRAGESFDLFFSADSARPVLLEKAGLTVPASRQTYARGQLALWVSREISGDKSSGYSTLAAKLAGGDAALTPRQLILLLGRGKHKLVVADPQLAPDGDAAVKMLKKFRLWPRLKSRMLYAGHAGHAQIMLSQGEGDMGLIPYGQALASGSKGQFMRIPFQFHPPIEQQLVILRSTRERTRAIQLLQYLRSQPVQLRLTRLGFMAAGVTSGNPAGHR
ncbi:molybdate ABC transporter substrate-binding protein [Microbulbifer sp. CAU 1566]|uniref:molybdate ABC transporter substrate-binding protein n=1 Tax=Microbulbifer sp. CAU 1566 TaxID=2933269 RepID=UPI002004F5BB|nr:molybdate ABC transporter substrate-binding protein [Microbulbifer sp. CAU 1566]MCK7596131.1 molybdate ABC transporter substrate-binding protein [Microbulbifer sp. CAU 1566]